MKSVFRKNLIQQWMKKSCLEVQEANEYEMFQVDNFMA